jgi:nitrogen regulatory protein PII
VNRKEYILFMVITSFGMGSKVLKEAKELGIKGGTIFLGKGTIKSHLLELLGLYEVKKEIILMIAEANLEDVLHEGLRSKFHLNKPNHGIAFSMYLQKVLGTRCSRDTNQEQIGGKYTMEHEVIFTIVDRGLAEDVVDVAVSAGASGGTIINARGAGMHEHSTLFSMSLEPEKEIVMILSEKIKSDNIIAAINKAMQIDAPGKGMLFTMDVNKTSGLFSNND